MTDAQSNEVFSKEFAFGIAESETVELVLFSDFLLEDEGVRMICPSVDLRVQSFMAGTDFIESSMIDLAVSGDMPAGMSKRSSPLIAGWLE